MPHIPSQDTRSFSDLSFESALREALLPCPRYDTSRWLFVPNTYTEYRYILGTRGSKPLICIGVNPSTAEPDHLDPTLQSVARIAAGNGFDAFIMLNVYAQRATEPRLMDAQCHAELHRQNLQALGYALSLSPAPAIWAAWGNLIEMRPWLMDCVGDMIRLSEGYGAHWFCCGLVSRRGHPHHPLYLRKDAPLCPFDARAYLQLLRDRGARGTMIF
ncbi:MAG: DUF1643 domain-containing protein [Clostridia bacterium]|nr:DUF1643 domain-containing protein [Clostridia bacterium]